MTRLGHVLVVGRGKVGRTLVAALRSSGVAIKVSSRAARSRLRLPRTQVDLLVLCCRDQLVGELATNLKNAWGGHGAATLPPRVALHVAGAVAVSELAPLTSIGVAIGKMHPLVSIVRAGRRMPRGYALVDGEPAALRAARRLARALELRPFHGVSNPVAYHLGATLVAGGAAALLNAATEALGAAGLSRSVALKVLAPLLQSVLTNVQQEGLPGALSGPVRRGATVTVAGHLGTAARLSAPTEALYRAAARAQLDMARQLGEADSGAMAKMERLVTRRRRR